jgi:hypothetical protein
MSSEYRNQHSLNRAIFNISFLSIGIFLSVILCVILIRFCIKFHQNYKKMVKCRTLGMTYDPAFRHWIARCNQRVPTDV